MVSNVYVEYAAELVDALQNSYVDASQNSYVDITLLSKNVVDIGIKFLCLASPILCWEFFVKTGLSSLHSRSQLNNTVIEHRVVHIRIDNIVVFGAGVKVRWAHKRNTSFWNGGCSSSQDCLR